jgi:iron(III) transport system substrate-binding protein
MSMSHFGRGVLTACLAAWFFALPPSTFAASQALIDAAKKEGRVTWYTTLLTEQASGPLAVAFEKRYPGIHVDVVRRDGSTLLRAIRDEATAHALKADVFDGTTTVGFLMKDGLVEPYKADSVADIPSEFRDGDGYWTPQALYFQALGYNADLVPENDAPKTYEDLLDPKWKGKLVWSVDEDSLTGALGFIANVLYQEGDQKGMEYLRRLAKQDVVRLQSGGLNGVTVALANKRYPVGITIDNHHVVIANAEGAHVRWVAAKPVLMLFNSIGLLKGAPHPNAAKLLIDFNLSVEGQTVLKRGHHIPASARVKPDDELNQGFGVTVMWPPLGAQMTEKAREVYKQLWGGK